MNGSNLAGLDSVPTMAESKNSSHYLLLRSAFNDLDNQVSGLEQAIERLQTKLSPISSETTAPEQDSNTPKEKRSGGETVNKIHITADSLVVFKKRINNLANGLDI